MSNAKCFALARGAKTFPPLNNIPFAAAQPIPPKKAIGTDITRAQGQEITTNIKALYIESLKLVKSNRGGIIARRSASAITAE